MVTLYPLDDGGVVVSGYQGSSGPLVIVKIDAAGEIRERLLLEDSRVAGLTPDGRVVRIHDGELIVDEGAAFIDRDRWSPDDPACDVVSASVAVRTVVAVSQCALESRATLLTLDGFEVVREWAYSALDDIRAAASGDLVSVGFDGRIGVFDGSGTQFYEGEGSLAGFCRAESTIVAQTYESVVAFDQRSGAAWSFPSAANPGPLVCLDNVVVTSGADDLLRFGSLLVVRDASSGAIDSVEWMPDDSFTYGVAHDSDLLIARTDSAQMIGGIGEAQPMSAPTALEAPLTIEDVERLTGSPGYTQLARDQNDVDAARRAWRADFVPAGPAGAFISLAVLPLEPGSDLGQRVLESIPDDQNLGLVPSLGSDARYVIGSTAAEMDEGEDEDRRVIVMVTASAISVIDVRSADLDLASQFGAELARRLEDR